MVFEINCCICGVGSVSTNIELSDIINNICKNYTKDIYEGLEKMYKKDYTTFKKQKWLKKLVILTEDNKTMEIKSPEGVLTNFQPNDLNERNFKKNKVSKSGFVMLSPNKIIKVKSPENVLLGLPYKNKVNLNQYVPKENETHKFGFVMHKQCYKLFKSKCTKNMYKTLYNIKPPKDCMFPGYLKNIDYKDAKIYVTNIFNFLNCLIDNNVYICIDPYKNDKNKKRIESIIEKINNAPKSTNGKSRTCKVPEERLGFKKRKKETLNKVIQSIKKSSSSKRKSSSLKRKSSLKRRASSSRIKTLTSRPSPNKSATEFPVGKIMKGNDGNMWVIKKTSAGIKRWSKK